MAGLEPTTYPLRRDCSTIELHRHNTRERLEGIEPSTYPWEGHVLPLNHSRTLEFYHEKLFPWYRQNHPNFQ